MNIKKKEPCISLEFLPSGSLDPTFEAGLNHVPWSFPCDSDTLTASWLLKELTPIMPWEAVLAREGIWLWLRGTLYRASAMSAALFRMIS